MTSELPDATALAAEARSRTAAAVAAIGSAADVAALTAARPDLLGKGSPLAGLRRRLGSLAPADRPAAGRSLSEALAEVEARFEERLDELRAAERRRQLEAERLDLTELHEPPQVGRLHVITQTQRRLEDVFCAMGYTVAEGPEIETEWHNFGALNFPPGHPARDMYDTLYVDHGPPGSTLLRTHTSPVQVRVMQEQSPPLFVVAPGRCYRQDTADATHMPVFHQIEGLVIDENITLGDLAGAIETFTTAYFGPGFTSRLRPSYFPFTEPSAEFDVQRPDGTWLELGGCGMVHPSVLEVCGVDPERWSGFAFGFGIDRLAMIRYGIDDLRDPLDQRHPFPGAVLMKVLLSWLREFSPIEGPPEGIAEDLSDLGLAVEDMVTFASAPDGIVVARVAGLRSHPDADRIQLVDVDAGDGEMLQVCCGAFNMSVGDLVPLATVGTTMPGGLEIRRRKMRGQLSEGMLCSTAELDMGADADGIMILPADLELGEDLTAALGVAGDVLFDLEVNPNRPDALSVVGVARDLAARRGTPFELPELRVETSGPPASAAVEIVAGDLCGRFSLRLLRNTSGARTPARLARRLLALGMRPINFVVDISNYVMLEIGQPSHAFDADLVPGGLLRVRRATEGEQVETLDGVLRTLSAGDGVIADASDRPIGIAGVMGGASTEISEGTDVVLLEAAWWNPPDIARTSRRLGLRSEASARNEAGVDPEIAPWALERFAELAAAGGVTLAPDLVQAHGHLPPRPTVRVRTGRVNAILGTSLTVDEMRSCLDPIGFE